MVPTDNATFVPGSTYRFVTRLLTPQEEMETLMSWEDPIQVGPGDATLLDSTEAESVSLWSLLLPPKLILVHSNRECLACLMAREKAITAAKEPGWKPSGISCGPCITAQMSCDIWTKIDKINAEREHRDRMRRKKQTELRSARRKANRNAPA
jgi:hypothetical protein